MDKFILGAGGHSRSLIGLLKKVGVNPKGVYDDHYIENETILGVPVLGALQNISNKELLIIGSGDPKKRFKWAKQFNIDSNNYIHPSSLIEEKVSLGIGIHIFADTYINVGAKIGKHVLINSKSLIEHESVIGDFSHIAVSAVICGRCRIGKRVTVGAGAIIKDGVTICDDAVIGAGAVVVKDITIPGVYIGVPAKRIGNDE